MTPAIHIAGSDIIIAARRMNSDHGARRIMARRIIKIRCTNEQIYSDGRRGASARLYSAHAVIVAERHDLAARPTRAPPSIGLRG